MPSSHWTNSTNYCNLISMLFSVLFPSSTLCTHPSHPPSLIPIVHHPLSIIHSSMHRSTNRNQNFRSGTTAAGRVLNSNRKCHCDCNNGGCAWQKAIERNDKRAAAIEIIKWARAPTTDCSSYGSNICSSSNNRHNDNVQTCNVTFKYIHIKLSG